MERSHVHYRLEEVKAIPIIQVVHDLYNLDPVKKGDRYWCALRAEKTPSCCIYPNNTWCDFGNGNEGGDVINLVQFMDHCEWKEALYKLGEAYHLSPEIEKTREGLSDFEWRKLGIEPDMASKNLDINVLKLGVKGAMDFSLSHRIPVNDLKASDPKIYYKMLRDRVLIPLETERDCYYGLLVSSYNLSREFGDDTYARSKIDPELSAMAEEINKKFALLRRAAPDRKLLKVPSVQLSPEKDLPLLLDGKLSYQEGTLRYYDLKKQSFVTGEPLASLQVPVDSYRQESIRLGTQLEQIPHAAYRGKHIETVYVMERNLPKMKQLFGAQVLKTARNFYASGNKPEVSQVKKTVPEF